MIHAQRGIGHFRTLKPAHPREDGRLHEIANPTPRRVGGKPPTTRHKTSPGVEATRVDASVADVLTPRHGAYDERPSMTSEFLQTIAAYSQQ